MTNNSVWKSLGRLTGTYYGHRICPVGRSVKWVEEEDGKGVVGRDLTPSSCPHIIESIRPKTCQSPRMEKEEWLETWKGIQHRSRPLCCSFGTVLPFLKYPRPSVNSFIGDPDEKGIHYEPSRKKLRRSLGRPEQSENSSCLISSLFSPDSGSLGTRSQLTGVESIHRNPLSVLESPEV